METSRPWPWTRGTSEQLVINTPQRYRAEKERKKERKKERNSGKTQGLVRCVIATGGPKNAELK